MLNAHAYLRTHASARMRRRAYPKHLVCRRIFKSVRSVHIHTYHPHLQKPERSCFHSFGGTPKARQPLMLSCLSLSVRHALTCLQVELLRMRTWQQPDLNGPPPKIFSCSFAKIFSETPIRHQRACDVTNRGGVRGGIPPRHSHTYHHHLQKPRRSRFHYPSDS